MNGKVEMITMMMPERIRTRVSQTTDLIQPARNMYMLVEYKELVSIIFIVIEEDTKLNQ